MSEHEIYAQNLLSDKGFAPWLPRPVDIAEVGYVDRGRWMRLFNASKRPGDESNKLGVPNGYRPLDVGELDTAMLSGVFPITNERGRSLGFGIKGSSAAIPVTSADGQYTFTSSKQEGAILVPGGNIDTADAVERSRYTRYIRENSASWLEFANERHHRDLRLIDLVFVTGWHKTASWGCAAFSQCSREINLTFNVGAGTTQGGVWGKWSDIVSPGVWGHSGPPREDGQPRPQSDKSPMNIDNLEKMKSPAQSEQMRGAYQNISADVQALGADSTNIRDQGIFIRGYKFCDRHTGLARILYRKHLKDGFTVIHPRDDDEVIGGHSIDDNDNRGDGDTDRDGDPSSSRQDPPSGGPGNSSSSPWPSFTGSQGGGTSRGSDRDSGPSGSLHRDNLAYNFKLDDDLVQYLQLNGDKEPTAVDIILEYILENSTAEFSLAHDDDVTELLQDVFDAEDFAAEIRKISPRIFIDDQVGMLYRTHMALLGDRPGKGHVAQGTPSTTAYDPHILQHTPPTGVVVGASRHPHAFDTSSLASSWTPSSYLLARRRNLLSEITGAASDRMIAINRKDDHVGHTSILPLYRMSDHKLSHHEIYTRNLRFDNGFAPYYPGPVNIGDVGYVFGGRWEPLFNACKQPGDESNKLGVPKGYRPLDVGKLQTRTQSCGSVFANERGRSGGSSAMAVKFAETQYTFTSSKQEGAILVPGDIIDIADAIEQRRYVEYIRENSASWLEFAKKRHHRNIRLRDLVLVTGWHKTASWACAVFSQCSHEINLTFNVGEGTTQGGVWGKWSDIASPRVRTHSGPVRANLKDKSPMNIDNLENIKLPARSEQMEGAYQHLSADVQALGNDFENIRDQGIFIRGYKIYEKRTWTDRIPGKHYLDYREEGFTYIPPDIRDA